MVIEEVAINLGVGMGKWGIGFVLLASFALAQTSWAFPARFGLSPDNDNQLLIDTIATASRKIYINMYQLDSPSVTDALISRIKDGVTVELLLEGQPVGSISSQGKRILNRLQDAMEKSGNHANRIWVMTRTNPKIKRRYRYDHAKYVVIDSGTVVIASENFTTTGHPEPGKVGNRGWEVVMDNRQLARQLIAIFQKDSSTSFKDVLRYGSSALPEFKVSPKDPLPPSDPDRQVPAIPVAQGDVKDVQLITSPRSLPELVEVIRSSSHSLDVEEMSLPSTWRVSGSNQHQTSPLLTEILAAAKRGVHVRVLLNNDNVFAPAPPPNSKPEGNALTVQLLNDAARCDSLPIEARIVDIHQAGITYIHNKGMLVDGTEALVSSINGTENAIDNNRETAVLLTSPDAAAYYGQAFQADWDASAGRSLETDSQASCLDVGL